MLEMYKSHDQMLKVYKNHNINIYLTLLERRLSLLNILGRLGVGSHLI